jgi:acyl-CoA synthetase (AMP-forming)/AMP-acid ligase II
VVLLGEGEEGCHSAEAMLRTNPADVRWPKRGDLDTALETSLLPYSSGTTGPPKGVCLTQTNLLANLIQFTDQNFLHRPPGTDERFIGTYEYWDLTTSQKQPNGKVNTNISDL